MRKFFKELLSNAVTLMVIVIILMMIIPIPVSIIDFVILLYWSLSMMILIITMSIHDPLEFSIFPTLLLITTLFGMGINVSTHETFSRTEVLPARSLRPSETSSCRATSS